jgi:RHS repeat-associated protein
VDSGNTWTFTYDAVGDRVAWVSGGTTYNHLFDPAGNWLGVAGSYSLAMLGNRPLVVYSSAETWFHHVNNIDSRTFMTNHAGAVTQDMVFYPWGGAWNTSGGGGLEFADLTYDDANSNSQLTTYRLFSGNLGRWHSPDPLGGDVTNPQSLNLYAYVANNPTTSIDPLGLCSSVGPGGGFDCSPEEAAQSNYSDPLGIFGILGGGGGGGGDCTMDGSPMSCGFASVLINQGAAAPCPGNVCSQWNANGHWSQFYAFAGAASAVNGFYSVWGVGSLQYSVDQAGISASEWGTWYLNQTGSEVGGSLWCAYGVCSSTLQQPGATGEMNFNLTTDFSDIPASTQGEGWWRAQTGEYSPGSDYGWMLGTPYSLYTGTPSGRVLTVGPTTGGSECVLVGQTLPGDTIPQCGR